MVCSNCGKNIPKNQEISGGIEIGTICYDCWKANKRDNKIFLWIIILLVFGLIGFVLFKHIWRTI